MLQWGAELFVALQFGELSCIQGHSTRFCATPQYIMLLKVLQSVLVLHAQLTHRSDRSAP